MYNIKIGSVEINGTEYEGRCLSVNYGACADCIESGTIPWATEGNPWDWKYEDGEFVYDELPTPIVTPVVTEADRLEAQILYTALMTDTLLEETDESED